MNEEKGVKVLCKRSYKTKTIEGHLAKVETKLLGPSWDDKDKLVLFIQTRVLSPLDSETFKAYRESLWGGNTNFLKIYKNQAYLERKFSIKLTTLQLIVGDLSKMNLLSIPLFEDTEADGIVFCGKCGKMK